MKKIIINSIHMEINGSLISTEDIIFHYGLEEDIKDAEIININFFSKGDLIIHGKLHIILLEPIFSNNKEEFCDIINKIFIDNNLYNDYDSTNSKHYYADDTYIIVNDLKIGNDIIAYHSLI
jgi:hypothetical protein